MNKWYSQDSFTPLANNEIHIWLNYLNVHEARIKHLYPLLSAAEKERSERFKFYKHRKAFIASHGFMHRVLAYYINTPENEIDFSYTDRGKPSIIESQNKHNIQFNLSHSNNIAMLAVCKKYAVGIDVEYANKKNDWSGISKRFFTENEQQLLFSLAAEKQRDAFFQIWTRKEAHMKVTGKGLSLSPAQFEVSVPPSAAEFKGYVNNTDNTLYNMQDIFLPDMFKHYFSCLSADFNFEKVTQFIHS
ncbi:hypothetical protein MNBD_GAMMA08-1431 [hydrothermal vent metagenome]|uniref:Uncharacterized protein n=1 Tax=hydrothermal vent metagenome TaxID=652676 RepID=A0A3B0YA15_9ZZZZ